jgi:predicted RND superfamily exporter protein
MTLLAAIAPTLVVGLGIDYCIHLLQAVSVKVRTKGKSRQSMLEALSTVARPLTVGAVTTTAAFLAMRMASLKGLQDMGLAGGLCIIGVFIAVALLFPHMLARCPEKWLTRKECLERTLTSTAPFVENHSSLIAITVATITLTALTGISRLEFSTDLHQLQAQSLPALKLQDKLSDQLGFNTSPLIVEFKNYDDATKFIQTLQKSSETVTEANSIPTSDRAIVTIHMQTNLFSKTQYDSAIKHVRKVAQDAGSTITTITGVSTLNRRIMQVLAVDLPRVTVVAFGLVISILILGTGDIWAGFLVTFPLACSLIWLGGLLGLFGVSLNVMSVAVAPLTIGVGVDDGLHMMQGWKLYGGKLTPVFELKGVAIVVTTLTTVIALGALTGSSTRGLVQFGWQAAVGLFFCMLVTLFALPLFGKALLRRLGKTSEPAQNNQNEEI